MNIAIAGTNGLAYWIAHYLSFETVHQFILLSRAPKPHLTARGWQVILVSYDSEVDLQFKLAGVDLVISMVSGPAQLMLIDAAKNAGVRRFAPAEFAGSSLYRPLDDALDHGQSQALARLRLYESHGMAYTVLACGILYDRFAPGGAASANIGGYSGANGEGDYLMDVRLARAQIPHDSSGEAAILCMTSAEDVGRFVVAALEIPEWPAELRMCGERMNVFEVVRIAELMRNREFEKAIHSPDTLWSSLLYARASQDYNEQRRIHTLMATTEGRFDFPDANLNNMVNVRPVSFQQWLHTAWTG